jgi:hypothetical protein
MKAKPKVRSRNSDRAQPAPKSPPEAPSQPRVRFEFRDEAARKVCIAGSFNAWYPDAAEMLPVGGGKWVLELPMAPGAHAYQLVVDGEWRVDPNAKRTIPNAFGGFDSVLQVES